MPLLSLILFLNYPMYPGTAISMSHHIYLHWTAIIIIIKTFSFLSPKSEFGRLPGHSLDFIAAKNLGTVISKNIENVHLNAPKVEQNSCHHLSHMIG